MKTYHFEFREDNILIGNADIFREKDGIYLANLYIKPKYRNRGLAKRFVKHLITKYHIDTLIVAKDNEIALGLYKNLGFTIEKEYYSEELETNVLYMKRTEKSDK